MYNGTEAVLLQFENVIGIVEWLSDETEPHGPDAWEHDLF